MAPSDWATAPAATDALQAVVAESHTSSPPAETEKPPSP
jgi:hypothetical protein